jgi:hypothetical protein
MEVLIVIGGLLGAIALGVPIAYALALAALPPCGSACRSKR